MRTTGQARDARVLLALERFRYLTTEQAGELYFQTIKDEGQRLRKASERLRKLYQRGLCYRMRVPNEYYIYSLKNTGYTHKVSHYLAIVDIWIRLLQLRPAGSALYSEVEKKQSHDIVTDLYIQYSNEWQKVKKDYFIEVELNSSGDIKDKIRKYESLAWSRSNENACPCSLVICTNRRGLYQEIEGYEWEMPVKVYPLSLEGWVW